MHVFIIAVITLDGFIARSKDQVSTSWTSGADLEFFKTRTKQAGVIVMGKSTYQTIGKPLKDRLNIIYTSHPANETKDIPNLRFTNLSPKKLLKSLEKEGFKEVAICGGSSIYTMFMETGLVNRLYITIEPVLFGEGVKLFNKHLESKLKLIKKQMIGDNGTLLLEYTL